MISPEEVYKAAKKKERENLRFRSFLKNRADDEELDRQFLALHNELFEGYNCSQCANCCRAYSTVLEEDEISAISDNLGMTLESFREKYLIQGEEGLELKAPCAFLQDDERCGIESCKPRQCREYPYTDKPERLFSLYSILTSAEHWPVVYEILERLKKMYHFR